MRTLRIISIILVALLLVIGGVSAYSISIGTPKSLQKGDPVIVNGTSDLPAGTVVPIQFSRSEYTSDIIETKQVVIQGEKNFTVSFGTGTLVGGQYKVEVLPIADYEFLSDSITLRVVQILDRSGEITFTSPQTQYLTAGTLKIEGTGKNFGNPGVQLAVDGPSGRIFGPEYISTSQTGAFSKNVPINQTGIYNISFTDPQGLVGTYPFTVFKAESVPVPVTPIETSVTLTMTLPTGSALSVSANSSRDASADFVITPKKGPLHFYTSSSPNIDWVMEYLDTDGDKGRVNLKGKGGAEEVTLPSPGGLVYVLVYPSTYGDTGQVALYAENAVDLRIANNPPAGFVPGSTTPPATTTAKSPASLLGVIGAIGILFIWKRLRR